MSLCRDAEAAALPKDVVCYYRIGRRDLVYLKFILEAYEGMTTMSTVDRAGAIVRLAIPAAFAADIRQLLTALSAEIQLQETVFGEESPGHA